MNDYRQLSMIYLKKDKKRSLVTVLGVTLSVAVLFVILNLAVSYLVTKRTILEKEVAITLLLTALLVSYVFAILGVGIVRNSLQLFLMERIRDYGILRCIGSCKKQLKSLIRVMGMTLELSGIAAGTVLGFLLYLAPAKSLQLQVGFHVTVLPLILFVFLGDLYFVIQENVKLINDLSPISAVKATAASKERLRARRSGLIGKLLGVEGDYAFKSLMRNPSRFWKSVGSVGSGIGMVIVALCFLQCIDNYLTGVADHYGWYQIYTYTISPADSLLTADQNAPKQDSAIAGMLSESRCITDAKPSYSTFLYPGHPTEFIRRYTQEFADDAILGQRYFSLAKEFDQAEGWDTPDETFNTVEFVIGSALPLFGYDNEDYMRLRSSLTEGTLELSDNGIILVNHAYTYSAQMDVEGNYRRDYTVTDYRVGDRITFVDRAALQKMVPERLQAPPTETSGSESESVRPASDLRQTYLTVYDCWRELAMQGCTKTYVIVGIVEADPNLACPLIGSAHFVLPLENYFQLTGLSQDEPSGQMYHMKGRRLDAPLKELRNNTAEDPCLDTIYLDILAATERVTDVLLGVTFFVLFIVLINIMNILNTTSAGLHLRRREFAQLKVLGMSQKRLIRTVLLEGIITAVSADLFGFALGGGIAVMLVRLTNLLKHVEYQFPWGACLLMIPVSLALFCGSIYGNLRQMKIGMAEELGANGE